MPTNAQPDIELIRTIERAAAQNLRDYISAYQRRWPGADSACIDVNGGVAAFTGRGSPLTTVKGIGAQVSPGGLDEIEAFFDVHGSQTVTIEAAPWLSEAAMQVLAEREYVVAGQEHVLVAGPGGVPSSAPGTVEPVAADLWAELLRRSSEMVEDSPIHQLLVAAAHLPNAQLLGVRESEHWIACAQSVVYDEVVIFCNDATLPAFRRKGAQIALIDERLRTVDAERIAVAEVEPNSTSERNYQRCGFRIAYARTRYFRTIGSTRRDK